jgi:protein JSN1
MKEKLGDVARSRFGARAVRACLESPYVSKSQQKLVASAIVQNAAMLITHQNGSLLIAWLIGMLAI